MVPRKPARVPDRLGLVSRDEWIERSSLSRTMSSATFPLEMSAVALNYSRRLHLSVESTDFAFKKRNGVAIGVPIAACKREQEAGFMAQRLYANIQFSICDSPGQW